MNQSIVTEALWRVTRWGLRDIVKRKRVVVTNITSQDSV